VKVAVDTNVIVRLLTNDEPEQVRRAAAVVEANAIVVSKTVLLETEWVLRAAYQLDRSAVNQSLRSFLSLAQVEVEDTVAVWWALEACSNGMDFADALHLAASLQTDRFATFDQALSKKAQRLPDTVLVQVL
jgi:predicted nucleic-acid-binding protein